MNEVNDEVRDPRGQVKKWLAAGDLRSLLVHAASLHGHYCAGLAFGVKAAYAALRRLGFDNTGMEELVTVVECNNCFADGIQIATGCSFGNNALIYKDLGKTAATVLSRRSDSAVRVCLRPHRWEGDGATELEREAGRLFARVVKERDPDPDARRRLGEVFRQLSFATLDKGEDELFDIRDVPARFPEYAPIYDSATCAVCGEEFMETRGLVRNGRVVCYTCAQADCFGVLGGGVRVLPKGNW